MSIVNLYEDEINTTTLKVVSKLLKHLHDLSGSETRMILHKEDYLELSDLVASFLEAYCMKNDIVYPSLDMPLGKAESLLITPVSVSPGMMDDIDISRLSELRSTLLNVLTRLLSVMKENNEVMDLQLPEQNDITDIVFGIKQFIFLDSRIREIINTSQIGAEPAEIPFWDRTITNAEFFHSLFTGVMLGLGSLAFVLASIVVITKIFGG